MSKIRRKTALALAGAAVVCALGFAGVAQAGGGLPLPKLGWPNGKSVPAGHIKLRVYIPNEGLLIRKNVFVLITVKRRVKDGLLKLSEPCGFRCTIVLMKRDPHSAHLYTYLDHFQFPGLWQDTPGTYYWQAYYYPNTGVLGVVPSRIGSFRVR